MLPGATNDTAYYMSITINPPGRVGEVYLSLFSYSNGYVLPKVWSNLQTYKRWQQPCTYRAQTYPCMQGAQSSTCILFTRRVCNPCLLACFFVCFFTFCLESKTSFSGLNDRFENCDRKILAFTTHAPYSASDLRLMDMLDIFSTTQCKHVCNVLRTTK